MISFVVGMIALVLGYFIYGAFVERMFGADKNRKTPCYALQDGVDFMPMPTWKVYLIQFLNIAGTGPIFGTIQGILFGPAAYIWIVFGCIFGGAVHDYLSGMISLRRNGESLPEIIGSQLGNRVRQFMCVLSMILMIMVGNVFATTPAGLLADMTTSWGIFGSYTFWLIIIFLYYFLATMLPIDKLIGNIYPVFGLAILIMAVGVFFCIFTQPGAMPEVTEAFTDHYPVKSIPLFPGLCITITCGAVSGFHATQSPMMARCLKNEKYGRPAFYGAMITEGLVALIWAAAAIKFADSLNAMGSTPYEKLWNALTGNGTHGVNPAIIVNDLCNSWMGTTGAILALLGVVAAPITTGDTAFRCARLIIADFIHFSQKKIWQRIVVALPVFALAILLLFVDFSVIWRYLAWTNQMLSVCTLWAITVWLAREKKLYAVGLVPALFMTMVCSTYILVAPEGLSWPTNISYLLGGIVTLLTFVLFMRWKHSLRKAEKEEETETE